ncbi:MAG: protease modulator HflC [Alphaproteobacteria bacterium]|nr:protease modulator HflC [Alphaproteobacteria bacterium]
MKLSQGIIAVLVVGALILLSSTFYTVHQVQQALVLEFGKPVAIVHEPGLHAKIPFIQDVEYFDNRLLEFNADPKEVIASDRKRLIVDAYVRYRISDPLKFYQTVRDENVMESRLNSILESSLRQVLGGYPLDNIVSIERAVVMRKVRDIVNAQTSGEKRGIDEKALKEIRAESDSGFGVEVVDVRIMRADLPKENSQAIFHRMQTEREREAKGYRAGGEEEAQKIRATAEKDRTIILAKAKKQAEITRGKGEAEATKIFAEAFGSDADFFEFYRSMQAYQKVLKGGDTTMVLSPESEFMRYFGETRP